MRVGVEQLRAESARFCVSVRRIPGGNARARSSGCGSLGSGGTGRRLCSAACALRTACAGNCACGVVIVPLEEGGIGGSGGGSTRTHPFASSLE